MNLNLKLRVYDAIEDVIEKASDENWWSEYIHEGLVEQMTNAAELVFDSAQDAQKFLERQAK